MHLLPLWPGALHRTRNISLNRTPATLETEPNKACFILPNVPRGSKTNSMKTSYKLRIAVCFIAVTCLGSSISCFADTNNGGGKTQSCPGSMVRGGMQCTLDGARVDEHGTLICDYTCVIVRPDLPAGSDIKALGNRAQAIAKAMNMKDPASVKKVNAELKKVHTDLEALAKTHGLKLVKKSYAHPADRKAAQ